MSDFEIDFECPIAKYDLRPATAEELRAYRSDHPLSGTRVPADQYPQLSDAERPLFFGRIIPSGKARYHRPKPEAMERAVRTLVECKQTPFHKVALTVARAIGALMSSGGEGDEEIDERIAESFRRHGLPDDLHRGDEVSLWYAVAYQLRLIFEDRAFVDDEEYTWPAPEAQYKGDIGIYLIPGKDNKPVLALRPKDLNEALVLYAARMHATGTNFGVCKNCKTPFLSGGAGRGKDKKRSDSRFCGDECRWKFHNELRRKARYMEEPKQ
jgi:hypothetical protein